MTTVLTPAFQTAPDALVGLLTGPGCISTMKAHATLGATKPFVLPALCTDADVLNDAGAGAKGTLFVRQTVTIDPKNADVKTYEKAMKRFASSTDTDDVHAQAGFASVMNLASLFLGSGATYTCDGTAFAGLKALCSLQGHVVEYSGKGAWVDKGVF